MEFEDTIASLEEDERIFDRASKESKRRHAKQLEALILTYQDACQYAIMKDARDGYTKDPCVAILGMTMTMNASSPLKPDVSFLSKSMSLSLSRSSSRSSPEQIQLQHDDRFFGEIDGTEKSEKTKKSPAQMVRMNKASMLLQAKLHHTIYKEESQKSRYEKRELAFRTST